MLDAHISGPVVGRRLREAGHDVLAVDQVAELEGVDDETLLDLASEQGRILITFDATDFPRIVRDWAHEGRHHPGCIILLGLDHSQFGLILALLQRVFERLPRQEDWPDLPVFLGRASLQG